MRHRTLIAPALLLAAGLALAGCADGKTEAKPPATSAAAKTTQAADTHLDDAMAQARADVTMNIGGSCTEPEELPGTDERMLYATCDGDEYPIVLTAADDLKAAFEIVKPKLDPRLMNWYGDDVLFSMNMGAHDKLSAAGVVD